MQENFRAQRRLNCPNVQTSPHTQHIVIVPQIYEEYMHPVITGFHYIQAPAISPSLPSALAAPAAPTKVTRLRVNNNIRLEISGNKLFEDLRLAIKWLGLTLKTKLSSKKVPKVYIKPKKGEIDWGETFNALSKRIFQEFKDYIEDLLEVVKRLPALPKNLKELVLWLLKLNRLLKWLARLYSLEFQHFMLFVAIFDQMRFRNLTSILDAFYEKKWKKFVYLLTNLLRVPMVMLVISLIKRDPYAGGVVMSILLPLFFFAKFRIPFLTSLLEALFSEIFPPEAIPIGTSSAVGPFHNPFRARRFLELLAALNKKSK